MADSFMQQLIASLARRTPVLDEPVSDRTSSSDVDRSRSKPALFPEDQPDFERTLDEVLETDAADRPGRLNSDQLRTMALTAQDLIAATAAREYAQYVDARTRSQGPAPRPSSESQDSAGVFAVIAVVAPVLAALAAALFLLAGYVLKVVNPKSSFASDLITGGWIWGAVAAAATLVAAVGLLVTALRHRPEIDLTESEEVSAAREAWLRALRRQGMEPFLRDMHRAVDGIMDPGQAPKSDLETDA
ncbi:hypothetical protein [Streptomyces sp. NPDC001275]